MNLIKNSALNVAGSIVPALIALPSIGFLARALDPERFGLLTLAWALVGYATLFDLGLSRAVAQHVAKYSGDRGKSRDVLGTAFFAVLVSGTGVALLFYVVSPSLVEYVFNVTAAGRADAIAGVALLGLTIPFLLTTLIVQGFLEGRGLFVEANIQKAVNGSLIFLMPAAAVYHTQTFFAAVLGILAARVCGLIFALLQSNRLQRLRECTVSKSTLQDLISYGGGIALTNTISPIMGYLDRFLLSSIHGAQSVGHYTGAAELVSRLAIIPVAISRALFPQLVMAGSDSGVERTLISNARLYTAASCIPVAVAMFLLADPLLTLWLGREFAVHSSAILRVLVIGFALNALAQVPFSVIQARGQSYLTAKIQLYEVIPYVAVLYFLGREYGAIGVAYAWTLRIGVDLAVMELFSRSGN